MNITALLIGVSIGVVGTLFVEHGWGWVLAQYHQRTGK